MNQGRTPRRATARAYLGPCLILPATELLDVHIAETLRRTYEISFFTHGPLTGETSAKSQQRGFGTPLSGLRRHPVLRDAGLREWRYRVGSLRLFPCRFPVLSGWWHCEPSGQTAVLILG
jgi:hypothetical protein